VNKASTANKVYRIEIKDDSRLTRREDLRYSREIDGLAAHVQSAPGYRIIELPSELVKSVKIPADKVATLKISQNSTILVSLIAVAQIVYAAYSLARVTGDQFDQFGYSAFSLTVLPYLVMSFVNLLGNLATPTYSSIYLVGTSVSKEAQRRGFQFGNTIGFLEDCYINDLRDNNVHIPQTRTLENFEMGANDIANRIENFRILPWSCQREMAAEYEDQNVDAGAPTIPCQLDNTLEVLNVCFEEKCDREHEGALMVPSGLSSEHIPRPLRKFLLRFVLWIVALGAHIGPIVYYRIKYGQPGSLDRKIIFPLWVAFGDYYGLLLLYIRRQVSILSLFQPLYTRTQGPTSPQLPLGYRPLVDGRDLRFTIVVSTILLGLAVGIWNFYLVAVQILEFGSCLNVSD
jgi:hypothetical protein